MPLYHSNTCPTCRQPIPEFGGVALDKPSRTVLFSGKSVQLRRAQFDMFEYILSFKGRVATWEGLYNHIYNLLPECDKPEFKIMNVHLYAMRPRLASIGLNIKTVWGVGLSLEDPSIKLPDAAA